MLTPTRAQSHDTTPHPVPARNPTLHSERPARDEELANIGIRAAGLLTDHDVADLGRKARLEN